jgi:hypothetical protein
MMGAPPLGSILLASTDPVRLTARYVAALGATRDTDGFPGFGSISLLIDKRDEIALRCIEAGRQSLTFHVDHAEASEAHLTGMGLTWLRAVEAREEGWFAMLVDPDDNIFRSSGSPLTI